MGWSLCLSWPLLSCFAAFLVFFLLLWLSPLVVGLPGLGFSLSFPSSSSGPVWFEVGLGWLGLGRFGLGCAGLGCSVFVGWPLRRFWRPLSSFAALGGFGCLALVLSWLVGCRLFLVLVSFLLGWFLLGWPLVFPVFLVGLWPSLGPSPCRPLCPLPPLLRPVPWLSLAGL